MDMMFTRGSGPMSILQKCAMGSPNSKSEHIKEIILLQ